MNAKEIFINLGNNVEIPINEDLEKALLKDTQGYKVIKDYIEQLEKEVELKDKQLDNQLNMEEIDFLLESEEERVNTYKNYEEIWKSCVSKLERQKGWL